MAERQLLRLQPRRRRVHQRYKAVGTVALAAAVATATLEHKASVPQTGVVPLLAASLRKALHSGSAGFVAGVLQVLAFMWLRTAMNYQYKFGGSLRDVLQKLYKEGGLPRFYRGLFPWAIMQAPLSRFGDVAANELVLAVTAAFVPNLPVWISTLLGSLSGAAWRISITPVDVCKTILQTDGAKGWLLLKQKVSAGGIKVLWAGWEGTYVASVVGSYPWFFTMNFLQKLVPIPQSSAARIVRSALCGAISSSVSDVTSNSIRVVTIKKQTHADVGMGYIGAAKEVIAQEGVSGLFFRGLEARVASNVLQGAFFTVMWKLLAGQQS